MTSLQIGIKRVYDTVSPDDGLRVLVDRIWPRGMTRDGAQIHEWRSELGPSHALRKWFGHRPERWEAFRAKYEEELRVPKSKAMLADLLRQAADHGRLTLIYSAKDPKRNQAIVLADVLTGRVTS